MPSPVRPGVRIAQSAGLTVFLATGIVLVGLVVSSLASGTGSLRAIAAVLSTLAGAVACFAMLIDSIDLWMLDRRMTPYSQKMFHSLVFVSMLVALGLSVVGRNALLLVFLAPSMVIYLLVVRKPPPPSRPAGGKGGGAGRQRRGGKKTK